MIGFAGWPRTRPTTLAESPNCEYICFHKVYSL